MRRIVSFVVLALSIPFAAACSDDSSTNTVDTDGGVAVDSGTTAKSVDPDTAAVASVDRFQDGFATLFKRSAPVFNPAAVSKVVPAPNAPIDLDNFLVKSFGPRGELVTYYSLDIISGTPQKAYEIVDADGKAIPGQLPVLAGVPGDAGYSDFARITTIKTKAGYAVNSLVSAADVEAAVRAGTATATETNRLVNWAVVPKGSTAKLKFRGQTVTGFRGWAGGKVAHFMQFETDVTAPPSGMMPAIPIIVIFKNDKDPSEGFAADATGQTHNVVALLPSDPGYTSFWDHSVGKLAGFDGVKDLPTAEANVAAKAPVIVNCPVVAP